MPARGITLLELMITLIILSLLLTLALPNLSQQIRHTRTKAQTNALIEAIRTTRTLAITHNTRATMRPIGSWDQGWQIFLDSNNNGTPDAGERLLSEAGPSEGVQMRPVSTLEDHISFIGTGGARRATGSPGGALQMGSMTVCSATGNEGGYKLVLAHSGRLRTETIDRSECANP